MDTLSAATSGINSAHFAPPSQFTSRLPSSLLAWAAFLVLSQTFFHLSLSHYPRRGLNPVYSTRHEPPTSEYHVYHQLMTQIKTVGYNRFGFDSTIETDVLRSLYLVSPCTNVMLIAKAPSYLKEGSKTVHLAGAASKDYGSESIYDKESKSIQYTTVSKFPPVKLLPNAERKRILGTCAVIIELISVTGGAGFVGSHLVDRLMLLGHEVTVLDNFFTGSRTTVRLSDADFADIRSRTGSVTPTLRWSATMSSSHS